MKTSVSIPDPLFKQAERLRKKRKLSRSRLYSVALESYVRQSYVRQQRPSEITKSLNRVYGKKRNRPDPFVEAAARETLLRSKW